MKKLLAIVALTLSLGACAQFNQVVSEVKGIYTFATTATVTSGQVGILANAYDALKNTAVNYKNYCIAQKFPRPLCSAANRRDVIAAVRSGDAARVQLEASIQTGQPATSTVYNALVAAFNALNVTPIKSTPGS